MSVEIDIAELHRKPNFRTLSSRLQPPASATESRDLKQTPPRSPAKAHSGQNSMGIRPQTLPPIYPIKDKTHPRPRRKKYREHEGKGCTDKFRYPNHAEAHEAIRGIIRKPGKKKFRSLKSYPCPICKGWHIQST